MAPGRGIGEVERQVFVLAGGFCEGLLREVDGYLSAGGAGTVLRQAHKYGRRCVTPQDIAVALGLVFVGSCAQGRRRELCGGSAGAGGERHGFCFFLSSQGDRKGWSESFSSSVSEGW